MHRNHSNIHRIDAIQGIAGFTWSDHDLISSLAGNQTLTAPGISIGSNPQPPFSKPNHPIHVAFYGTLLNPSEIRNDLTSAGHTPENESATELLRCAYETYGLDAIHVLRGAYAFALWDAREKQLWLARDRFGATSLHYRLHENQLLFASDIQTLLKVPGVERALNEQALFDYLGFGFTPTPDSLFKDLYALPPGHQLIWKDGKADVHAYWDLSFLPSEDDELDMGEQGDALRKQLNQSVEAHLAHQPAPALWLSNNPAPHILAALVQQQGSNIPVTFSLAYPDQPHAAERNAALAQQLGATHHPLSVEPITLDDIEAALQAVDLPLPDPGYILMLKLFAQVRDHAPSCWGSQGAMELFAGHPRFQYSHQYRSYARLPAALRDKVLAPLVQRAPLRAAHPWKQFMRGAQLPEDGRQMRWYYQFTPNAMRPLFLDDFMKRVNTDGFHRVRKFDARCDAEDDINRELYIDTRFVLPNAVLPNIDRIRRATGLDTRYPWLDHKLAEQAAALPGAWKLNGARGASPLLRTLAKDLWPNAASLQFQPEPDPYSALPLHTTMKPHLFDLLHGSHVIQTYLDVARVKQLIEEHDGVKCDHSRMLWSLMNITLWHRYWIENKTDPARKR